MIREMKKAFQYKESIVLDATFYERSIRNMFCEAAKEFGLSIIFIEVWANQKIIIERLKVKRQYSDADYSVYLHIKDIFEPMRKEHLVLQSTQENIVEMMGLAFNYIQKSHE